jgi:hypothetical protein
MVMNLTKEETIKEFRAHWDWCSWNPAMKKTEYPGLQDKRVLHQCFLCEFTRNVMGQNCEICPIEWPRTNNRGAYPCTKSHYGDWEKATTPEERSRLAALIRDLPEKKDEKPTLKVDDWVKIVNVGSCFDTYGEFFKENNVEQFMEKYKTHSLPSHNETCKIIAIGKHNRDVYGPLYLVESLVGRVYIMHNIEDRYLELTNPPAPKFAIGNKVVPVGVSWVNWTLEKYQNYHSDIPDFLRKNGYLCVSTVKDGEYQYLCGTDNLQGQDRFKESELIPYVEPPKFKFKVGDIVKGNSCNRYGITNADMTRGEVTRVGDDGMIDIKILEHKHSGYTDSQDYPVLEDKYFDLVVDEPKEVKPEPVKPFGVGDRVKTKLGIGIIKDICNGFLYGVEFQKELSNGSGRWNNNFPQKINFGWYFYKRDMEFFPPINVAPENKTFVESGATFIINGSTTICIIEAARRNFKGTAECKPNGAWDEAVGKGWAGIRAIRKVLDATEKELRKR